jgi:hypothetical protein
MTIGKSYKLPTLKSNGQLVFLKQLIWAKPTILSINYTIFKKVKNVVPTILFKTEFSGYIFELEDKWLRDVDFGR